jgi:hypothetical protein
VRRHRSHHGIRSSNCTRPQHHLGMTADRPAERQTSRAIGPDWAVTVDSEHNLIIDIGYGGEEDTIR